MITKTLAILLKMQYIGQAIIHYFDQLNR